VAVLRAGRDSTGLRVVGGDYGDGEHGFLDRFDDDYLGMLRPLNPYGWSKHVFDRFVLRSAQGHEPVPPRWVGLKFFNVYGPNEYHKGGQRSVAAHLHARYASAAPSACFARKTLLCRWRTASRFCLGRRLRRCGPLGAQDQSAASGLYNVGSGVARSFYDKARIMFAELGVDSKIEFIDLSANLKGKYQYYTCASLDKLRAAGYNNP